MQLPAQYAWLEAEPGPTLLREALKTYGLKEAKGDRNNPEILRWADELGLGAVYRHDSTAWCGLAVGYWAHRTGREPVRDPLWALNWRTWGEKAEPAMLGDVLVFTRKLPSGGIAGHVGIYVGEDAECFHVLGGNQSDAVTITRIERSRLRAARHPTWKFAEPSNRRVIRLAPSGRVSRNEA